MVDVTSGEDNIQNNLRFTSAVRFLTEYVQDKSVEYFTLNTF